MFWNGKKKGIFTLTHPDTLLPIGSVVRLKDGEQKLMITGMYTQNNGKGQIYDYIAVLYPYGFTSNDEQYMFKHEDIEEVFFVGFDNEERKEMLKELVSNMTDEGLL